MDDLLAVIYISPHPFETQRSFSLAGRSLAGHSQVRGMLPNDCSPQNELCDYTWFFSITIRYRSKSLDEKELILSHSSGLLNALLPEPVL